MAVELFGSPIKKFRDKLVLKMQDYSNRKQAEAIDIDVSKEPNKSFDKLKGLILAQAFRDFSDMLSGIGED